MCFSVLIPLEFHRGLAERCIRGWSQNQTFAREECEILVAAPDDHEVGGPQAERVGTPGLLVAVVL